MIKIIAVDDEPAFGELLSIYLEGFGDFEITAYTSPEDAIDKIIAGEADAVITDYRMEDMDGITLIRKVKALVPDIPFVLLTGQDEKEVILNAMNAGADFIQFKTEEPARLFTDIAQKITNSVEKYRARKESEEGSRTREILMRAQRDLMERLSVASTSNQALDATLT
ncbi:MAG: response regulator, partial [Methanomicrobiales archaeon]|nr:response regulator [Methanomicrobiales archaeon]